MSQEQEYNQLLDELLAGMDTDSEVGRRVAHRRCLEYAQNELSEDAQVNVFLALAAQRLGQTRVHFPIVQSMVAPPEGARLHLTYSERGGPTLTGNADGLRYLSDLCAALSSAPTGGAAPAEHVHLRGGEPPMFGRTYDLTLYHEPDEWFDQYAVAEDKEQDEEDGTPDYPRREVDVNAVAALAFFPESPLPPPLLLTHGKLYRVFDRKPYQEEQVWAKRLRDDATDRMFLFTLHDDNNEILEFALDLDDPEIRYFTYNDLEQVMLPPLEG